MAVTGYQLRRILKDLERQRSLLQSQWQDSLYAFAADERPLPEAVLTDFYTVERRIAALQAAQMQYNQLVQATVRFVEGDETMPLGQAVKLVGGADRLVGMLEKAAKSDNEAGYYGLQARSRSLEEEHQERRLPLGRAGELLRAAADRAAALRQAIAVANDQPVELPSLDPTLLA
ncbi:MAG: hypothetical protein IT204_07885 [Fimbriimonadaceae bacterium]|nr:hypothetical protein [Fimbriimonadaceae bacterium]